MAEESSRKKEGAGFFRLGPGGRAFVEKTKSEWGTQKGAPMMQMHWLCAQLGLVAWSKDESMPDAPPGGNQNELVQTFGGKTREYQVYYRSFLMYRHLCGLGYIDFDEEMSDPIEQAMNAFLQSSGSHLTNDGMKILDSFAQKGWDIIESRGFEDAPTLSDFLPHYVELIIEYSSVDE
tara:strand:+ start:76 stop:609 length:534 start_codon:yes stop_codon:yes gene_type:complete